MVLAARHLDAGGILGLAWPMAKRLELFGITYHSMENKPFKLLFQGSIR